jgi:hypothetical protein
MTPNTLTASANTIYCVMLLETTTHTKEKEKRNHFFFSCTTLRYMTFTYFLCMKIKLRNNNGTSPFVPQQREREPREDS